MKTSPWNAIKVTYTRKEVHDLIVAHVADAIAELGKLGYELGEIDLLPNPPTDDAEAFTVTFTKGDVTWHAVEA